MKIALAQLNPTIGDFDGNLARMAAAVDRAREAGARLVIFSELATCGYPPHDLLEYPDFLERDRACVAALAALSKDIGIVAGHLDENPDAVGKRLCNAVSFFAGGKTLARHHKALLPTYDVFDERRYFEPRREAVCAKFEGLTFGLSVCEDAWNDADFWPERLYDYDPVQALAAAGAQVILNVSASPFHAEKPRLRFDMLTFQARKYGLPLAHVNQVGGNDELIFDGHSMAIDGKGNLIAACRGFEEDLAVVDLASAGTTAFAPLPPAEELLQALTLGLRDYFRKCGFSKAVVGLSGGIDSALVTALARLALGPENVLCLTMPSQFSSAGSVSDSADLAARMGIELRELPIQGIVDAYLKELGSHFKGLPFNVAEENLQARARGNLLMAFSNKFGHMVLSTGNKSEMAVGYCTLYGDMSGGLAVIGDLPKMTVYELSRHVNAARGDWIPQAILDKEPSAELRPDQKDSDSLPPYPTLDAILHLHLERHLPAEAIVAAGHDADTVRRVIRMVRRNEYKRRQAAPVLKVTRKSFGLGRRMPLAWRME